jgi:hypothetical protein
MAALSEDGAPEVLLRLLGWFYIGLMLFAAGGVVCLREPPAVEQRRWAFGVLLLAFFAVPVTAVLHLAIRSHTRDKRRRLQRLMIGMGAYVEALKYLLSGGRR